MNRRRHIALALACSAGFVLSVCAAMALWLAASQRMRGIEPDAVGPFAPYVADRPALGVNVALERYAPEELRRTLADIHSTGLGWIRQTFAWADIQPEPDRFEWSTADRIIDAIESNAVDGSPLRLIAVLDTSPGWANPASRNYPPQSSLAFARFARAFAQRYGDRVDYYQIWDEPNLGDRWNGAVNPVAYAELLRQARDAIREVDPNAVILLAGLAPTVETSRANMADWLFLRQLYEAGAQDAFDVVAGKPYGFDTGPDDRLVDPNELNFSHILLLREEMASHGDAGRPLWVSHFGWNTHPQSIWGHATPEQQAAWTRAAVQRARDEWPWLGVMILENWQPAASAEQARWGFSLLDASNRPEPLLGAVAALAADSQHAGPGYHPAAVPLRPGGEAYGPNPLARFDGDWRFGQLGADWGEAGGTVAIPFDGTSLALHVRRSADRAHLYVSIDGQPANALPQDDRGAYLQLIPPERGTVDESLIPVATGLSDGPHVAEITTERGWNQWSLIGWSVAREEDRAAYRWAFLALGALGLALACGAVYGARRVSWGPIRRAFSEFYGRLSGAAQLAATALAAAIFYASAWLAWGAELSSAYRRVGDPAQLLVTLAAVTVLGLSPWLILTILSGLVLFVLICLRLDLGLMLVAFFAPFHMLPANLFHRFSSMVEITLLMCAAAWLVQQLRAWRRSRAAPHAADRVPRLASFQSRLTALDWAVLALFVASTLSLLAAEYFSYALREWRIILLEPMIYYLLLRTSRLDRAAVWRIVNALVLAGVAVAVIGLVQYAFNLNLITAEEGTRRLRSVYGSPNNVGLFLGRVLPIALALALVGRGRRRLWYALALLPIGAAILLSQSRGAILIGVPASILAIGLLAGGRVLWATIGALAVGGLAAIPLLQSPRMQALLSGEGTQVFRVDLWRGIWNLIRDHPILGVGPDNFLYAYRGRYMLPQAWEESGLSHPHNVALDFAARLGLLGLAALVWIQAAFWRTALPLRRAPDLARRALAIGLMASMVDCLTHGLVDAAYFVVDLAFVFMLTLALIHGLRDED